MLRLEATWQKNSAEAPSQLSAECDIEEKSLPFYISTKATLNKRKPRLEVEESSDDNEEGEGEGAVSSREKDQDATEEETLENLVFGSSSCLLSNIGKLKKSKMKKSKSSKIQEEQDKAQPGKRAEIAASLDQGGLKPAWQDADDSEMWELFFKFLRWSNLALN